MIVWCDRRQPDPLGGGAKQAVICHYQCLTHIVEPTGPIFDDPNLTDKKFPGNPTQSYRSREPLRITGEVATWEGHSPQRLQEMKDFLEHLKAQGVEAID